MALEGSSLTLLGLVKYDSTKDAFEMTELFSVLSGGLYEAKRCLDERIGVLNEAQKTMFVLGGIAFAITLTCNFFMWSDARARRLRD